MSDPAAITGDQVADTEAYRRSPYPMLLHPLATPDRMATIARLAGMTPPDVRTARVLDIGVSNCIHIIAMAQAAPEASFVGIDIDPDAIAIGGQWLAATGLANVRLEVIDLLDGVEAIEGEFDYIIAHGVYAWVPAPVAAALLELIAAKLSPDGVAFVSFNTFPGCYSRLPMRDVMLRAGVGAADGEERLARGRAVLTAMAESKRNDSPSQEGLRAVARELLESTVLLHDELGGNYRPSYLRDVIARAGEQGLAFLGDVSPDLLIETFLPPGIEAPTDVQAFIEDRACTGDETDFRFFRRALLVRREAAAPRVVDPAIMATLFAASRASKTGPETFSVGGNAIKMGNAVLNEALQRLIAAWPARIRVSELGLGPDHLQALLGLFDFNLVNLHTIDAPFTTAPIEHPVSSPLARAMLDGGLRWAASLDLSLIELDDQAAAVLRTLDGQPDNGRLAAVLEGTNITRAAALGLLASRALLLR